MSSQLNILSGCSIYKSAYDESSYNYYRFVRPGGSGVIMRESTDETDTQYFAFTKETSETAWTNRATNHYASPGDFSTHDS